MRTTSPLIRFALGATAVASIAGGLAQAQENTKVIKPSGTVKSSKPIFFDTRNFFPQISSTTTSKVVEVKNPSLKEIFSVGQPNGLTAGKSGGPTASVGSAMFPGISFTGLIPADPQIAVSKTHIVQVVNSSVAFFNKTGVKQLEQTFGTFFSSVPNDGGFDPKIFYDKGTDRFFMVVLDTNFSTRSQFLIAVSASGNPNGQWKKFAVDNMGTDASDKFWLDYEGWGYNKDVVVATGNMFPVAAGNVYVQAFVMKKSEMIGTGTVTAAKFDDKTTFTIQVAKMDDTTTPFVYGSSIESNSSMKLYAWRNFDTTPEMVSTVVTVPSFSTVGRPPSLGGAVLDSLSGRLVDATWRTGSLLVGHTTRAESGANRSQCTWYEFKPGTWPTSGTPKLAQAGNVTLPGSDWAFIPGINKNSLGDIAMIFTRSSENIAADIMVASRKSSDPAGTMGTPQKLATSDAAYRASGRWGDYVSVCVDPTDSTTFWGNHMKSASGGLWNASIVSWKVSTGGGGGGIGVNSDGISVLEGGFVSGDLNSVKTADGVTYNNSAVKKPDGAYATAVQTTFSMPVARPSIASFTILGKAHVGSTKQPTGTFFVWNWLTSKWDAIKSYTLSNVTGTSYSVDVTNMAAYLSTTNKVKVMLRGLDPVRNSGSAPAPFTLKSDLSKLSVIQK